LAYTSCRCSPIRPWSHRPHIAVALVLNAIGQNNDRLGLLTAGAVVVVIPILAILAVLSAIPRPTHRGDRPQ